MSRLKLAKLEFSLAELNTSHLEKKIRENTACVKKIGQRAGQNNSKFKAAVRQLEQAAKYGKEIEPLLISPVHTRAYAVSVSGQLFSGGCKDKYLSVSVLNVLDKIIKRPSGLLVDAMITQYFRLYDELKCYRYLAEWLLRAKEKRKQSDESLKFLLSQDGPKAFADRCTGEGTDFVTLAKATGLNHYGAGRYYNIAQLGYYINRLELLKPNEPSDLLTEIMQPSAYNTPYTATQLLGHKALEIIIDKAPRDSKLHPQWEKFILSIAGDPRIPKEHLKFRTWWSYLGEQRIAKVRSWLSRLDLKIFLDILEQYARTKGDLDMQRMYPPRKKFLEGLFAAQLVTGTRLYLSAEANLYAKRSYAKNELPKYSVVTDNKASIIVIQMGDHFLVEGSHNCMLWLYETLSPRALIHNYNTTKASYRDLTKGMDEQNQQKGHLPATAIVHHASEHCRWQSKTITQLKTWRVNISAEHVIEPDKLNAYLHRYGF